MTKLVSHQEKKYEGYFYDNQQQYKVVAKVRHDDECRNGHNTFSITGTLYSTRAEKYADVLKDKNIMWYSEGCGCIHDEIVKAIPQLAPYIKWHLCSTDGPMHYIANTIYLAGDRDCCGLRKGEVRQLRKGATGKLSWKLVPDKKLPDHTDSDTQPTEVVKYSYQPWCRTGEGKERQLQAAAECAIWPEATVDQLLLEPEELKKLLEARLPQLMIDFQKAVESLGLVY